MQSELNVAVAGVAGRMGRMLIDAVVHDPAARLTGALEHAGHALVGQDAAVLAAAAAGVRIVADPARAIEGATVLIDFTRPEATLAHLAACRHAGVGMVIGTTGLDAAQRAAVADAAREVGVVFAPNMSVGVNVAFRLIETAARILGGDYDVEVLELHHRHKVDAPSGTALRMGEVVAQALGRDLAQVAVHGRAGVTGERRGATIGFHALRGGDIVGDHTVYFCGAGERLEITHRSSSRANYALGAVRAARWLQGRGAGLYDMQDVLGLR